jgi:serine protease Do
MTTEIAESFGFSRPRGVLVQDVHERGPATKAGLKRGDVIVSVDDHEINSIQEFNYRFATKHVGGEANIAFLRGGKEYRTGIGLESAPEDPPRNTTRLRGRQPFAGAVVANLSPALAEELQRNPEETGVIVLDVRGGPARRIRLRKGDVIVAVEDTEVESVSQLVRLTQRPRRVWHMVIKRGGRLIETSVPG